MSGVPLVQEATLFFNQDDFRFSMQRDRNAHPERVLQFSLVLSLKGWIDPTNASSREAALRDGCREPGHPGPFRAGLQNAYATLINRPSRKTTSEDRRLATPTKSIKY